MGLKPGYKQTDIGVIPEDWDVKKIKDIALVSSGGTPDRQNSRYWNGIIPWITTNQIDFNYINSADEFITPLGLKNSAAKIFPKNTLLIAMYGQGKTRGKIAILNIEASTNQASAGIKFYDDSYILFFFYYLSNQYENIRKLSNSGNQENLSGFIIKSIDLPVPSPLEQQAIADALSDVDALIESLEKLIAKKRDIKQATMQQLLTGKKRLEGFGEEWKTIKLGDIGECLIGLTYSPENVKEDGLLVLRSSNVENGIIKFDDNVFVNIEVNERIKTRRNDILICVRNGSRDLIGKCALIDEKSEGLTFGAFMSVFRSSYAQFIFWQFQSDIIKRQIHENIGATINQITNKNLESFEIPMPCDKTEQQAIVSVLSDMDAEIGALEQRLEKMRNIKAGMMQELLTGRIRLV